MSFLDFSLLDLVDILLVAFLLYQLYRLLKGTVAINIFIGVAAIYLVWKLVEALQMELLSEILGKFIGVGVLALVIVFQQEIRRFLLVIGSTNFTKQKFFKKQLKWFKENDVQVDIAAIVNSCTSMSETKTGAIIVIEKKSRLGFYTETGTLLNAHTSTRLLESIFNKHSPLHDGAVIISGGTIMAAGCILPITEKANLPSRFGLRHRAAMGVAEKTDAIAIVVSEETGNVSITQGDEFIYKVNLDDLANELEERLSND